MAFGADKGYLTPASMLKQPGPKCSKNHDMNLCTGVPDDPTWDGWGCDGRFHAGGCRSGITSYHQTKGVDRFRCEKCDYDLCRKCVESKRTGHSTHHAIDADMSPEDLATIEHEIMEKHG